MIPTYHCAAYLRETLESVLAQDPGPERMQIEVIDDHSTADDPEAVVREPASDRVAFHRQSRNVVGHVASFNTCLRRARGGLVHLLRGASAVAARRVLRPPTRRIRAWRSA
jgi:glycosyltransferase involved in cell wall biosynthesis